jgi:hypothetical protein
MLIALHGEGRTLMLEVEPGVFVLNGLPIFEIDENGILVGGLRFDHLGTSAMLPPELRDPAPTASVQPKPARSKSEHKRLKATRRPTAPPVDEPEPELPVYGQPGEDDVTP